MASAALVASELLRPSESGNGGAGGAANGGTQGNGAAGGLVTYSSANGGAGLTGGRAGDTVLNTGNSGSGGNVAGANVLIDVGTATGSGAVGTISLGSTRGNVNIGRTSATTTITGAVGQSGGNVTFRDSGGTLRYGVDANGLPSLGHRFEFRESWMWGGATSWTSSTHAALVLPNSSNVWILNSGANAGSGFVNSTGWTPNNAGTGGLTFNAGTAGGAAATIAIQMGSPFIKPSNVPNLAIIGEWGFAMNTTVGNGTVYRHGWSHVTSTTGTGALTGAVGTPTNGAWFESLNGAAWSCKTDNVAGGGTTTTTVSGTSPVVSTGQIFRIEQYGAGTPYGQNTVKFFIDGTQVCLHTTNIYVADTITWNISAFVPTSAISQTASMGSLFLWSNLIESPAAP